MRVRNCLFMHARTCVISVHARACLGYVGRGCEIAYVLACMPQDKRVCATECDQDCPYLNKCAVREYSEFKETTSPSFSTRLYLYVSVYISCTSWYPRVNSIVSVSFFVCVHARVRGI